MGFLPKRSAAKPSIRLLRARNRDLPVIVAPMSREEAPSLLRYMGKMTLRMAKLNLLKAWV